MAIGELLTIGDRWKNATLMRKIVLASLAIVILGLVVLEVLSRLDPAIEFIGKYKIIITDFIMDLINMPVLSLEFAALLILSLIITIIIVAVIVVFIIVYMEKRVYDTNKNAKQKIAASKNVAYNLYKALDKLSKFPYSDGTPTGREASLDMTMELVRIGFPSAGQLNPIIERVREKDANIVELIERAKSEITANELEAL